MHPAMQTTVLLIDHILSQSAGKLSTRVAIKPPNVLSQNSLIEEQPNLVHLTLSSQLVQHDLNGGYNEDSSCNTKEDIHLCVDALEEVVSGQAFRLATDTALENLCIGCGRCDIKSTVWEWWEVGSRAVHSSICQADENLG